MLIDNYNRHITYLRLSVTGACNLRCDYCRPQNDHRAVTESQGLSTRQILTLAQAFVEAGIEKIRLTGGEPLLHSDIITLIEEIRNTGVRELALTTNGILLKPLAPALAEAGLDRINISLDTLKPDLYKKLTGGGSLDKVLKGIDAALEAGLTPVKINTVLMKGVNDSEIKDLVKFTLSRNMDVRFIEMMPIGRGTEYVDSRYVAAEEVLRQLPELEPVSSAGSVARHYRLPGAVGRVGLITPVSSHFCGECNRIRINSSGQLTYCLLHNRHRDLKPFLEREEELVPVLKKLIRNKPVGHENSACPEGNMFQIGG